MKLKPGDMVSCNLTSMCGNVNILMNMLVLLAGDIAMMSIKYL